MSPWSRATEAYPPPRRGRVRVGVLTVAAVCALVMPALSLFGEENAPSSPPSPPGAAQPAPSEYKPVYGDIEFERKGEVGLIPPAVFPHWFHRMRFRCYVCHPAVFQMRKGTNDVTMQTIREGKFCGTCHTGKLAWQITLDSCQKCHKGAVRQPVAEKKP